MERKFNYQLKQEVRSNEYKIPCDMKKTTSVYNQQVNLKKKNIFKKVDLGARMSDLGSPFYKSRTKA